MKIRQMTAALLAAALLPIPAALASWDGGDAWDPPGYTAPPDAEEYLPPSVTTEPEDPNLPPSVTTEPEDPNLPPSATTEPEAAPSVTTEPDDPNLPPSVPPAAPVAPVTPAVTAEYRVTLVSDPWAEPQVVTVRDGESLTLPDLPDRQSDGAVFAGWTMDVNAEEVQYRAGDTVYPGLDMVLYAVYTPDSAAEPGEPETPPVQPVEPEPVETGETYTVTYRVNGENFTETLSAGLRPSQTPALPAGFTGWQDENGTAVNPANTEIWADRVFTAVEASPENPPAVNPAPGTTGYALRGDHSAFMSGYTSGLFQPDVPLTRAHVSKILYELLASPAAPSASFTDVKGDEWYADFVRALGAMGIVRPDENGAFRGTDPITRAEFAEILSNFVPAAGDERIYPDVPESHWAYTFIRDVSAAGLFGGDSAGNFNPEGRLTRAQAATVFNRLLGRSPDGDTIRNSPNVRIFPDVPVEYWAYDQIMEAAVTHTSDPTASGGETWTSISADPSPLADGYYNFNGYLFRQVNGKFLRSTAADGYTYDESGRYTTGNDELDGYITGVLRRVINSSQTETEKLRAIFNYVRDNFTYLARAHVQSGETGWEESYAVDFFQRGKGNCFSFSAAFYELARALGVSCKTVIGTVGSVRVQDHGWVEVYTGGQTWLYDTELEMAYRTRNDYRWNLCRFTYSNAPFTYVKLSVSG